MMIQDRDRVLSECATALRSAANKLSRLAKLDPFTLTHTQIEEATRHFSAALRQIDAAQRAASAHAILKVKR
jgi:hypothetical protein